MFEDIVENKLNWFNSLKVNTRLLMRLLFLLFFLKKDHTNTILNGIETESKLSIYCNMFEETLWTFSHTKYSCVI